VCLSLPSHRARRKKNSNSKVDSYSIWIVTNGETGEAPPDEIWLIHAARYLGVAPWELERQPLYWLKYAELAELIERRTPEIAAKIEQQRARVRGAASADD
jgi:hypothetical protein